MSKRPIPDWDPRDPDILRDQRRAYDRMRERCPVAYSDFLGWSLFHHRDIEAVLADPETFSSFSPRRAVPNGMDPPEHTRYRHALEPFFTPERMAAFAPTCRRIAAEQAAALRGLGTADFVAEFAEPVPLKAHCAFLGWPMEWWDSLRGWTHGNMEVSLSRDRVAGQALATEFAGYVREAVDARRAAEQTLATEFADHVEEALRERRAAEAGPGVDVTAALMATTVNGAPMS
ncbi:MAG: cytochrome P450, partial [Thermomicrobiales bacterium]|nr:cytochrome P450 [Thermomicrobiales bacterium]